MATHQSYSGWSKRAIAFVAKTYQTAKKDRAAKTSHWENSLRVFIYEHIVGGGLLGREDELPENLLREGAAMHRALVEDFAALDGVKVSTTLDARLERRRRFAAWPAAVECVPVIDASHFQHVFDQQTRRSDWTLVVAPEIDAALLERTRYVVRSGTRLLGLSEDVIRLASDKHATADWLFERGVPCTQGVRLIEGGKLPADLRYPAVAKPCDGAGCEGIVVLRSAADWHRCGDDGATSYRVEPIVTGTPASATLLCGLAGAVPLLAGRQDVQIGDRVTYHGGDLPLSGSLGERAVALAERVAAALPQPLGCGLLGVDMVLRDEVSRGARAGDRDVVVEVNPRVTTSYVALRRLVVGNLAGHMLDVAEGRTATLAFDCAPLQFTADGQVRPAERV
ncbi:MAG: ATP-grasp domain-containing protein [Planctomycetales bacterium]|nr:ATP-grasp domain-containing protein [Planctomycetales bacterium]